MMKNNNSLLKADTAVENYLDTLLQEATGENRVFIPVRLNTNTAMFPAIDLLQESDIIQPELEESLFLNGAEPDATEIEENIFINGAEPGVTEINEGNKTESESESFVKPSHDYKFPIQCLMFRVGVNQLSIPLIDMGSVLPWVNNMTHLPHVPDWFVGLMKHRGSNVTVVDSANILKISIVGDNNSQRHILVFGDENWAITCDQLGDVVKLDAHDVQWSKPESSGLSLGTIKQSLAILLDPGKILTWLNQSNSI